jgi:undecaprenyl-diphosphatase
MFTGDSCCETLTQEERVVLVLFACFVPAVLAALVTWWVAVAGSRPDPGAPRVDGGSVADKVRRHPRAARWLLGHFNPGEMTGSLLAGVGLVAIVGAAGIGLLFAMVRTHQGFAEFDTSAARFGATHATQVSTTILRLITQIGGAAVLVPVAAVVAALEGRRLRSWTPLLFLTVVVGGQYILANVIKALVGRARPDLLRLTGFSGPSFPSGHATAAAATFAAFALLAGRRRTRGTKIALAAVSVGLAVLVAATRVLLGVHWLTDVMAGLCLGWTWFEATSIAFGGRRLQFAAPLLVADRSVDDLPGGAGGFSRPGPGPGPRRPGGAGRLSGPGGAGRLSGPGRLNGPGRLDGTQAAVETRRSAS